MDLFRKTKKKYGNHHDATAAITEGLAQMVIAETTDSFDNAINDNSMDGGESSSAIDALIDSDEAEIFNDSDEDDDLPPDTPASVHSTLSSAATGALHDVLASLDSAVGSAVNAVANTDDEDDDDDDDDDDDNDKSNNSDSAEDYTDDEDEGEDGYKAGGYHPVKVGEVYNQRCVRTQGICHCICRCVTMYITISPL